MTDVETPPEGTAPPWRGRRALLIAAAVGVVVAGLVVVLARTPPANTRLADSPLLGKDLPSIAGRTIDGGRVQDSDLRGRWTLVNFFATWCVPCRKEHPELIRFAQRHATAGDAAVVAIIYDDTTSAVRDFRKSNGGDWPMIVDPDGQIALNFGVSGVPESFLVSPDGVIVSKILGGVTDVRLETLLDAAKRRFS
jgi:cytochrome c biogenesis protein CcmG, thiol:disulfide interchange protein DsbE